MGFVYSAIGADVDASRSSSSVFVARVRALVYLTIALHLHPCAGCGRRGARARRPRWPPRRAPLGGVFGHAIVVVLVHCHVFFY